MNSRSLLRSYLPKSVCTPGVQLVLISILNNKHFWDIQNEFLPPKSHFRYFLTFYDNAMSLSVVRMATIGDLPDLPLLRIFSMLQYPDIISAGQTCLRWFSLCHPLWTKIAEEIEESWSQDDFYPLLEDIRHATILGRCIEVFF